MQPIDEDLQPIDEDLQPIDEGDTDSEEMDGGSQNAKPNPNISQKPNYINKVVVRLRGRIFPPPKDTGFSIFKIIRARLYYFYLLDEGYTFDFGTFVEFVLSTHSKNLPLFPYQQDYDNFKDEFLQFVASDPSDPEDTLMAEAEMDPLQNEQILQLVVDQTDTSEEDYLPDISENDFYRLFNIDIIDETVKKRTDITALINKMVDKYIKLNKNSIKNITRRIYPIN